MKRRLLITLLWMILTVNLTQAQIPDDLPRITFFSSSTIQVSTERLRAGNEPVSVMWEVRNQPANSKLFFEQILEDWQIITLESPESRGLVTPSGVGEVFPVLPDDHTMNQLRLRLVLRDLETGWDYDTWQIDLPLGTETKRAQLNQFEVSSFNLTEGELLTVTWDVSGVEQVIIDLTYSGQPRRYALPEPLPAQGTTTFTVPPALQANVTLYAYVEPDLLNPIGSLPQDVLTVEITCQYTWFDPSGDPAYCPEPAQQIEAVYQPFQHGYMLERAGEYIWFYFANSDSFLVMPGNLPVITEPFTLPPPADLFRPLNTFGQVWADYPTIREQLGWATAPERAYTMTYQQTPWAVGTALTRYRLYTLPDGTVEGHFISSF